MRKRIADTDLKYLNGQIEEGCSVGGDFDENHAIRDLFEARAEVKRLKKLLKIAKAVTP